ncbi:MAG: hypothetical protein NTW84_05545 [Methanothrix sp.]|nr:hypothetical protein [Methanothrix sp.]
MPILRASPNRAVQAVAEEEGALVEGVLVEEEAAVVAAVAPGEAEGHFMRSREMKIPEVDLAAGG